MIDIRPQEGFQMKVATSTADINFIGGAMGAGKSFIMEYIPLMYRDDAHLRATYFRRTKAMITKAGSLWDESLKLYPLFNAEPTQQPPRWKFPSGMQVDFDGIENESDTINFQGAQIPLMLFDELPHFTKKQFFFMMSRNRGVLDGRLKKPQIFASMNPDPDSWVSQILIDGGFIGEDGYPIPEMSGVHRYFIVIQDEIVFGSSPRELFNKYPDYFKDPELRKSGVSPKDLIKSFTFIPGTVYENKILLSDNPQYLGSLLAQEDALKDRNLRGNWKVRTDNTGIYLSDAIDKMFHIDIPSDLKMIIGYNRGKEIIQLDHQYKNNFITCDAARFGRDLCVILVWKGFTIVHCTIFYISSPQDIFEEIEVLMQVNYVLRPNVCIDQDGVGGDVVALGRYYGFVARRECVPDPDLKGVANRVKENYASRKDQCYFRSASRLNRGEVKWVLLAGTCKIFDKGAKNPRYGTSLKWGKGMIDIKVLVSRQLRAIKRGNVEFEMGVNKYEGGILRLCTNSKDEQKSILGHSPDIADSIMMREDFELRPNRGGKWGVM